MKILGICPKCGLVGEKIAITSFIHYLKMIEGEPLEYCSNCRSKLEYKWPNNGKKFEQIYYGKF